MSKRSQVCDELDLRSVAGNDDFIKDIDVSTA